MSKDKSTVFEELGYGKFDPKPSYRTFSMFKSKEGWVVMQVTMQGLQAVEHKIVCKPTVRAHAIEQLKIHVAKYIMETA